MIKIPYYETSNFVFSNFSPHTIFYKGVEYPTVEHAYHSEKFDDEKIKEEIKNAKSPLIALELAKKYKLQRKKNWNKIKIKVLLELVKEKVNQHDEVKNALLATGVEEIVEDNPNDSFWGVGRDGKGENQMGKILMRIRKEIKSTN